MMLLEGLGFRNVFWSVSLGRVLLRITGDGRCWLTDWPLQVRWLTPWPRRIGRRRCDRWWLMVSPPLQDTLFSVRIDLFARLLALFHISRKSKVQMPRPVYGLHRAWLYSWTSIVIRENKFSVLMADVSDVVAGIHGVAPMKDRRSILIDGRLVSTLIFVL